METTGNIIALFKKYISGTASVEEVEQLSEITDEYTNDELADILEPLAMGFEKDSNFNVEEWEPAIRSILQHPPERKTRIIFTSWYRVAAAAVIVLLLSVGGYFYFNDTSHRQARTDPSTSSGQAVKNDVPAPASNRATITLANGKIVSLDSLGNGTLATQGNVNIIKTADGKIVYQSTDNSQLSTVASNTLTNPRGSNVVDITLADGSRVWLNAGSSVTYPVAFISNERKVQVTGEAYFEVAHNALKPFSVSANGMNVQVLGTHFNINAYDDENVIRTTLLEGSVKVSPPSPKGEKAGMTLKPGQQAKLVSGQLSVVNNIDLDEVMAWKNGEFQFGDKSDIKTIMRQISRWYDVEVEYRGNITGHIGGSISRNVNVSQVLKMLEKTGGVKFKIEGNKITVMP